MSFGRGTALNDYGEGRIINSVPYTSPVRPLRRLAVRDSSPGSAPVLSGLLLHRFMPATGGQARPTRGTDLEESALPSVASVHAPFNHPAWVFELKYDGFRALAYIEAEPAALCPGSESHTGASRSFPRP